MAPWVVVVRNENDLGPSVIGPFDTSEDAAEFGNSIQAFVTEVKISTLNPPPKFLTER